jgi:hypothetical protein
MQARVLEKFFGCDAVVSQSCLYVSSGRKTNRPGAAGYAVRGGEFEKIVKFCEGG